MAVTVDVYPNPKYPSAKLVYDKQKYDAVVGSEGVTRDKKEGDCKTPIGSFSILGIMYRPDKVKKLRTAIPARPLTKDDIWIDDVNHSRYNQPAKLGDIIDGVSYEKLWRDDHLHDVVVDLDYNRNPAAPGKGSAIFLHVAHNQDEPAKTPTAGCIAMREPDLIKLLESLLAETKVVIHGD